MRTVLDVRLLEPDGHEPGLVVDVRDEARALLVDLGEIERLSARTLLRVSHAFVTHTHMDHFAGFDHLLALGLGRMRAWTVWGGPGFVDQVEHKLRAYTWNVVHRYEVPLCLQACALEEDGRHVRAVFDSRRGFVRERQADGAGGQVLLDEPLFRVRATLVDHEMPVMALLLEEKAQLRVRPDRLAAMGLGTGAWLATLKAAVRQGLADDTPIDLAWRDAQGSHAARRPLGELRELVLDAVPGRRIGYVTDLRFTPANVQRLQALMAQGEPGEAGEAGEAGVDVLYIESVFLHADAAQAARKNHLTARQAGQIARAVGARRVVPFHFSPRYRGQEQALRDEVAAAHAGR